MSSVDYTVWGSVASFDGRSKLLEIISFVMP